jgi:hypothetical protein
VVKSVRDISELSLYIVPSISIYSIIWLFCVCWCYVLRWIWCLWCYSECASTPGQANFSACPVWMHTQSNITNIIGRVVEKGYWLKQICNFNRLPNSINKRGKQDICRIDSGFIFWDILNFSD